MSPNASYSFLGKIKPHNANLQPLTRVLRTNNKNKYSRTVSQKKQNTFVSDDDNKKAKFLSVGDFKATVKTEKDTFGYHIVSMSHTSYRLGHVELRALANNVSVVSAPHIKIRKGLYAADQIYTLRDNLLKHEGLFKESKNLSSTTFRPHSAHPLSHSTSYNELRMLDANWSVPSTRPKSSFSHLRT